MLAASENQADCKILSANENQADCKILEDNENHADGKFLAAVEISTPGEIPAFTEKLAELEKQAACLLFRIGGISNC
jgi:hypothetical protein